VNRMWRSVGGRTMLSAQGRAYFTRAFSALPHERVDAHEGRLAVTLALVPPSKAALDIDNRVKAVFDACTHGKVWLDDSQVDEMHAYRMPPDPENPHVRIMILEL
jgi:crossover junction endodeoxyribonuclease RusA